ncbi:MAG TPA: VOC family protein [Marmoricola sp.]|jgi:hypothetical protein|nr:VOC family protein [Marmoricola sp.]
MDTSSDRDNGPSSGIATFKELCLDTHPADGQDVNALGRFWAAATGCEYVPARNPADPGDVIGTEEGMGIALCPVPEPKTVKQRVHLDVSCGSLEELTALGATVLRSQDDEIKWTVMADPEGGELCAFVRTDPSRLAPYRVFEIAVDSVNAESITRWWADVFGVEAENNGEEWWWITGAPGFPSPAVAPFWAMVFGPVPEPKTVKNRLHWDVYGEVADFIARGATLLWEMPRWTVLADPEGNEFCVFAPPVVEPVETA